jgi:hypothetical protein
LESFIELLAGAKSGQGDGLLAALYPENIKHIGLGVLNYSVFSGVHAVAMQLFPSSDDPSIWRHLILQPAGLGSFSLDLEKVKAIARLSEDLEELKRTLHQFDEEMTRQVEGISLAQRGLLIGNFLQNLSSILTAMGAQKKQAFSKQVESALNSIDQSLKTQILGSLPPDLVGDDDTSVFKTSSRPCRISSSSISCWMPWSTVAPNQPASTIFSVERSSDTKQPRSCWI